MARTRSDAVIESVLATERVVACETIALEFVDVGDAVAAVGAEAEIDEEKRLDAA